MVSLPPGYLSKSSMSNGLGACANTVVVKQSANKQGSLLTRLPVRCFLDCLLTGGKRYDDRMLLINNQAKGSRVGQDIFQ